MANEKRARFNSIGGLIDDNPLTNVATTLTSAGLAAMGLIDTTNHAVIVLDPDGLEGAPEIVYVTAHAVAATTATIVRAQEGTAALAHSQDVPWVHAATTVDFPTYPLVSAFTADVTIAATSTWYDGPTLSVPAGTWLISGVVDYQGPTDWFFAKLWDGTTVYGANGMYSPTAGGGCSITIPLCLVVLAATTTVKLSGATFSNTGGLIKATTHLINTGTNGKVSRITALKWSA